MRQIEEMTTEDILDELTARFPAVIIGVIQPGKVDITMGQYHVGLYGSPEEVVDLLDEITDYIKSELGPEFA